MWSRRGHTACFLCRWFDNKVAGGENQRKKKRKKKKRVDKEGGRHSGSGYRVNGLLISLGGVILSSSWSFICRRRRSQVRTELPVHVWLHVDQLAHEHHSPGREKSPCHLLSAPRGRPKAGQGKKEAVGATKLEDLDAKQGRLTGLSRSRSLSSNSTCIMCCYFVLVV